MLFTLSVIDVSLPFNNQPFLGLNKSRMRTTFISNVLLTVRNLGSRTHL